MNLLGPLLSDGEMAAMEVFAQRVWDILCFFFPKFRPFSGVCLLTADGLLTPLKPLNVLFTVAFSPPHK